MRRGLRAPVRAVKAWVSRQTAADWSRAWGTVRQLRPAELRRRWDEFRVLRAELFDTGGATIDWPRDVSEGSPLLARTVVQPDGDVLWVVHEDFVTDAGMLRSHSESVAGWYESASDTVTALRLYLRTLLTGASVMASAVAGIGSFQEWGWWAAAVALALVLVLEPIGRAVIGRLMRRGMTAVVT
jgi:hypothetical protein